MTFEEWYESNKETLSQRTLTSMLRDAHGAGFLLGMQFEQRSQEIIKAALAREPSD